MKKQFFDCDIPELVSDLIGTSAEMKALILLVHGVKHTSSYSVQQREFLGTVTREIVAFLELDVPSG